MKPPVFPSSTISSSSSSHLADALSLLLAVRIVGRQVVLDQKSALSHYLKTCSLLSSSSSSSCSSVLNGKYSQSKSSPFVVHHHPRTNILDGTSLPISASASKLPSSPPPAAAASSSSETSSQSQNYNKKIHDSPSLRGENSAKEQPASVKNRTEVFFL